MPVWLYFETSSKSSILPSHPSSTLPATKLHTSSGHIKAKRSKLTKDDHNEHEQTGWDIFLFYIDYTATMCWTAWTARRADSDSTCGSHLEQKISISISPWPPVHPNEMIFRTTFYSMNSPYGNGRNSISVEIITALSVVIVL